MFEFLATNKARFLLSDNAIRIEKQHGAKHTEIDFGSINTITASRAWFWSDLTISLVNGTRLVYGRLSKDKAEQVRDTAAKTAAKFARGLSHELIRLDAQADQLFSVGRYARHSSISPELAAAVKSVVSQCRGMIHDYLPDETKATLDRFAPGKSFAGFEPARERANNRFIKGCVSDVKSAMHKTLPVRLTDQQAEAIATDEDVTLVLAGAGTGKTAVVLGKVAHLVNNLCVPPKDILILAYNRKAAQEIRKRLPGSLSEVDVYTFHSFGRRVIADTDVAPMISSLVEDDLKFKRVIDDIIDELLRDPKRSSVVTKFITDQRFPYYSAFDFDTKAKYMEHIRGVELRTLNGVVVKSFEELRIANYLSENSIAYQYEKPYKFPTATKQYGQYRPDFYLPDYDIYIEHFALDQNGRPPPDWKEYDEGVAWKRSIHRKYGSTHIETYSWQYQQDSLIRSLHEKLKENGVGIKRVSRLTLIQSLAKWLISWLANLIVAFLNHVKNSSITSEELRRRASGQRDLIRNMSFLELFEQILERYKELLAQDNTVDFHDLINIASRQAREGRWKSPYKYVLVDEFQDISKGRMELLKAINGKDVAYFLVGDDWQSIYRFAGSDVGLVWNCEAYLGHVQERQLTQTFRFGQEILDPSTAFIRKNKEQTQRTLQPNKRAKDDGVTIVYNDNPAEGLRQSLQDIEKKAKIKNPSVMVLGRYGRSKVTLNNALETRLRKHFSTVDFSTVHTAKGREADYVAVLDLKNDPRRGFPSRISDDPLLKLVLPPITRNPYQFAEERRLFYVAMTRARAGLYLITDQAQPSSFVEELVQMFGSSLRQIGERDAICPSCGVGVLRLKNGKYGQFLGCSEYTSTPRCQFTTNTKRKDARIGVRMSSGEGSHKGRS